MVAALFALPAALVMRTARDWAPGGCSPGSRSPRTRRCRSVPEEAIVTTIEDVGPTLSNAPNRKSVQFPTGRMLSVDSSDDGRLVFAGSFSSNLWTSEDGGESWSQVGSPEPDAGQFGVPGAIGGYCVPSIAVGPDSALWSVERDPRLLADLTGRGRADIVGFGNTGVWTALSNGDGTFQPPRVVLADFGFVAGGWRVDRHPRFLADITGDGRADIVGFGDAGVYVALSNGDGTFQSPRLVLRDFGFEAGGWRVDRHPRFLADITGDGRADIIGFGDAGVYVALSNGDGTFRFTPVPAINDFGFAAGGWRIDRHPRFLADITGDGRADIVGFGNTGVWSALSNGNGTFQSPRLVLRDFGVEAGGWRVDRHPRFLADITGDGRTDIIGFGDAGVYVALSNGNGTFRFRPVPAINDFGFDAGGWRVDRHPRFLADITGDGRADIIGFGDAGVYVSLADRRSLSAPRFVLANFGFEATVLAMVQSDREAQDAGVWRSSDRGATWTLVHSFPRSRSAARLPGVGQLVWAAGTSNLVYAAGGSSLAVSTDGGATFADVMPLPTGGFQSVTHVAVAETPEGGLRPPAVYALASGRVFVSLDAGTTWIPDGGPVPGTIGGTVGLFTSQNDRVMVVSPRSPFEVFATANAQLVPPEIWRGDYGQFAQTHASQWTSLHLPNLGQQFSGNVFVAATRPGHGEALFYGPQRSKAFVAPLNLVSAEDWHELDDGQHVHIDLHGIFLSPDFAATFEDGSYRPSAGTAWMASDGGIFRSRDGGQNFHAAGSISTLSVVNIAGTALPGTGPLISLNTGDNDGFTSRDGGRTWRPMDYGGGDNDTSWADPLRPTSMLVFTPRWDENGEVPGRGRVGQTLALYESTSGELPDVGSRADRQIIPGPSARPGSTLWNASSFFTIKGYRPLVLNLPGDDPAQPGDYVFIRFFGNFNGAGGSFPNNLAVLLRTRRLRDIRQRTDWDTPGGWRVEKHPRLLADLTADGHADIVGFGDAGVWTALATSGGSFANPRFVLADLGFEAGGWRMEKHPRVLADVTGDGRADIVAFGDAGVYVALSNGDGTFAFTPVPVIADFGFEAGGWRVDKHLRVLADVTGDGRADIVGSGDAGVYVALSKGDGTFQPPRFVLGDLGFDQGWRVDRHPRMLADVTGDGRADIVGFGDAGVYVARSNGDGTFAFTPVPVINDLGFDQGWRVDRHPRFLADVTGHGRADIIGFGNAGVYVARSNGDGTFAFTPVPVLGDFGFEAGGWQVDRHPRLLADVTGDGTGEIVGFGDAGVLVGLNNGDGTFRQRPLFVIPNFGFRDDGPVEQQGPFLPDPNVSVVQASGGHTGTVFYVGGDGSRRLWKWTDGMAGWQQLVPGGGAVEARRFFVHPYAPNVIYLLDTDHVLRSDDGGANWRLDASLEQQLTSGGRIPAARDEDADGQGDHYDVILSDMQFDPFDPRRRFAVGLAGAFVTTDGVTWQRLLDTGALRGRPANCYFDQVSQPADPALYVSFAGRSIVKITGFAAGTSPEISLVGAGRAERTDTTSEPADVESPGRRPLVRIRDGRLGTTRALPDGRVLITFADGGSLVVDADRFAPDDDGGYAV
jgi:hypothetical protein